jgi:ornithine cyclodeaminase/alanine dehydrogenase-like protein (mu-crystallin family)
MRADDTPPPADFRRLPLALLLTNEHVDSVLDVPGAIAAMEAAYTDLANHRAVNVPRTDAYAPHPSGDSTYALKFFAGLIPRTGLAALRIDSDIISWEPYHGNLRKEKRGVSADRWNGLVLLYSIANGELVGIMPDGVVQRMRVAATNAIGVRYLARRDASVYGLLGTGWQAGTQIQTIAAVRNLREIRVFSPNREHREQFARTYEAKLGLPVRAVDSARDAVTGADIVGAATNAIQPLIEPDWLEPGMHITCIKRAEFGEDVLDRCDFVAVHTRHGSPINYIVGMPDAPIVAHDPLPLLQRLHAGEDPSDVLGSLPSGTSTSGRDEPDLADVVAGRTPVELTATTTTGFVNNIGVGIQFGALCALVYDRARERGLGRDLPSEWFTQDVHN